ncbi:glycosyltransferase [Paenibacillus naphthalenovorans]|uniref:Group 1 glycosyl transferase n=1 Tax=Paenibacillus naphthalenovorans TaxID=162209 RepID=A0A0U2VQX8_9BACL|nr:glycosyltransferase [Paenibacillus naphthalenovorans]ALS21895.1 group 1 glycosyl transferase [Paenibacillus naphthalenovorans]
MKILIATYWHLPHVGGVSTYVTILAKCLEQSGHEVDILAQHPDMTHYYFLNNSLTFKKSSLIRQAEPIVLSHYEESPAMLTPWMFRRECEKYAFQLACLQTRLDHYDVIHTQDIYSTLVLSRVKPANIPLVATIHGCLATEWVENNEARYLSMIEREYLALEEYFGCMSPDSLILPSRWLVDRLSSFHISHANTHIIPYGIDQHAFQRSQPARLKINVTSREPQPIIIACPARLVAIKGQTYLLEAMALLVRKRKGVVCWLIGDGLMKEDLEKQIHQLGIHEHVKLLGKRSDVPELLASADIVVLPSLQDNLPFSIIEAQSAGKPVVASRVGGIAEMIEDGNNGFFVSPRNAQELYEKLLLLVEDGALRERLSNAAKAFAHKVWNDQVMTERTFQVYQEAIGNQKAMEWKEDFVNRLTVRFWELFDTERELPVPSVTAVKGNVVVQTDPLRGVPGAHVHLIDMSGVVLCSAQTNHNGHFWFPDVQPGNYALVCSAANLGSRTVKTAVSAEEPISVEIVLPGKP